MVTLPPDLKVAPTPCLVAALGRTGSQLELEPKVSEGLQSCTLLLLLLMSYAVVNLIGMSRAFLTPLYRSSCCVKFAYSFLALPNSRLAVIHSARSVCLWK